MNIRKLFSNHQFDLNKKEKLNLNNFLLFMDTLSKNKNSIFYSYIFMQEKTVEIKPDILDLFFENKANNKVFNIMVFLNQGIVGDGSIYNTIDEQKIYINNLIYVVLKVKITSYDLYNMQVLELTNPNENIKYYFSFLDNIKNDLIHQVFQGELWIQDPFYIDPYYK